MPSNLPATLPSTRREFLQWSGRGIGLLAFSRFAPAFLVQSSSAGPMSPETGRPILVLVQLAGGNDGLNTLVPFEDANYYRLRPTLGIAKDRVLRLTDTHGLHPSCPELARLFHDGQLGIVQNVGYPNPNRSHFRSTEIWETASASSEFLPDGWIGRFMDNACAGMPASHDPLGIHISNGEPQSFVSTHEHPTFGLIPKGGNRRENEENRRLLEALADVPGAAENDNASFLRHTLMDSLVTERKVQQVLGAYQPAAEYPGNAFAGSLRNVAALIAAGLPTRVYFVSLSGFDTHSNQANQQANLLATLSAGLAAFQQDLVRHQLDGQVLTMTFSEFGRRPNENESRGTDHGTAAPLFVMGSRVKGGLHGTPPSLDLPPNQDLAFSTDFRGVYATMLDRWLGCPSEKVLGGKFATVPVV
ncbi:MAG TPA: DUF1501 domain-containing protein [Opitutaceae bacterium]|nr:DUF1501 domain-containing protein [Opitutaceae bacterium]HND60120.1 DUF1501 domain-containing protein [Opitutaceae bacterium]